MRQARPDNLIRMNRSPRFVSPELTNRLDGGDGHAGSRVSREVAAALLAHWSPRVVAELDDSFVKVAKVHGTLAWHRHDDEDELFFVLRGCLKIAMAGRTVELGEGEAFVVPKGVLHNPVAEQECLLMLIEKKSTLHTGSEVTARTRSLADQLRPWPDAVGDA